MVATHATEKIWAVTHPDGRHSLAGFVKRTYRFDGGALSIADEQDPIAEGPDAVLDDDGEMIDLRDDTDLVAPKACTDVVVHGTVVLDEPATEQRISVAAGRSVRVLQLHGPRRVEIGRDGRVRFSSPERFERLALDAAHAYGGHDRQAQRLLAPWLDPYDEAAGPAAPRSVGTYAYPRNAAGCGYFIDVDRIRADGTPLPQIEDPQDRLRPASFFVPDAEHWMDAPIAANLGWVPHMCYPRIVRLVGPVLPSVSEQSARESTFPDGEDLGEPSPVGAGRVHPRAIQGAAPGLATERLRRDELVCLEGMVPDHPSLRFYLPGERPKMELLVPELDRPLSVEPVLQTLRIDLDRRCLSLTWCGAMRLATLVPEEQVEGCRVSSSWRRL
ncbi:MAG: DUF2169 domain-containing protein [Polyangiaceae bacterium]